MISEKAFSLNKLTGLHRLLLSSGLIQAAGLALTTLLGIQLARFLGPTQYGIYGLALAVVSIATVPAQFGLPLLATREAARIRAASSQPDPVSLVAWFATRFVLVALLVSAALGLVLELIDPAWLSGRDDLAVLTATMTFAFSVVAAFAALLRGFGANLVGQSIDLLVRPALIAGAVFIYVMISGGLDVREAIVLQIATAIVCILLALGALVAVVAKMPRRIGRYHLLKWKRVASSFMANSLLGTLNANYPILVVGLFVAGQELGIFRVALASSALLGLPSAIANIAAGPLIAFQSEADHRELNRTLSHTTLAGFALTFSGWLFLLTFGRLFIGILFGDEYRAAYAPLLVLGVGQVVISAFGVTGSYLNLTGRHSLVMRAFLVSVPMGVASSLILNWGFGSTGAAWGPVVMAIVWHLYVFGLHRSDVDVPLSLWAAVRYARIRPARDRPRA